MKLDTKTATRVMLEILHKQGYVAIPEVRVMTGWNDRNGGEQRLDIWAIHPYPSKRTIQITLEIKVSRSDWLNELKKPRKSNYGFLYSNEFYFVAPPGIIKIEELPREAGLILMYPSDDRAQFRLTSDHLSNDLANWSNDDQWRTHIEVKPPWRESYPPSWRFIASLLRRQQSMQETTANGE